MDVLPCCELKLKNDGSHPVPLDCHVGRINSSHLQLEDFVLSRNKISTDVMSEMCLFSLCVRGKKTNKQESHKAKFFRGDHFESVIFCTRSIVSKFI